ncbi:MAG TPA: hypothetical protein VKK61_04370 [Tepidisphaeraceae bacterium]|nr:hypothetical protein [Tepidisphaeraceae bacterium]
MISARRRELAQEFRQRPQALPAQEFFPGFSTGSEMDLMFDCMLVFPS